MRTDIKRLAKLICLVSVMLVTTGQAFAYPPENAAVLYYRAFMLWEEPNSDVDKALGELWKGNIKPNEHMRRYVARNRNVIRYIVTAAEIRNCDWGLDFSEGFSLAMPQLAKCRRAAYLLAADAKVSAERGDYRTALERCITIQKMAAHIGEDVLICYLVGTAINEIADECIIDILSEMPENLETLAWLQSQMVDESSRPLSVEAALAKETELALREMRKIDVLLGQMSDGNQCDPNSGPGKKAGELLCRIQQGDEALLEKSRENFISHMAAMRAAFKLPYPQAHEELTRLAEKISKDAEKKPEAILASIFCPAIAGVSSMRAESETLFNAVKTSIEIYITRAKTGKLPEKLPCGLPKDMFSGKDFLYEKTTEGFLLKCQGRDLDKDKVHEYTFEVIPLKGNKFPRVRF